VADEEGVERAGRVRIPAVITKRAPRGSSRGVQLRSLPSEMDAQVPLQPARRHVGAR
jgi:hypothetical protein